MIQPFSKHLTYMTIVLLAVLRSGMANAEWHWEEVNTGFSDFQNERFLEFDAMFWRFSGAQEKIYNSSDGVSWNEVNANIAGITRAAFVHNNMLWMIASPSLNLASSSDGINWQIQGSYKDDFPNYSNFRMLSFNGEIWSVGRDLTVTPPNYQHQVIRSEDSFDWLMVNANVLNDDHDILKNFFEFDGRIWLQFHDLDENCVDAFWSSANGGTWTRVEMSLPLFTSRSGLMACVFEDNLFLMGGICEIQPVNPQIVEFYNEIWYSPDGSTWNKYACTVPWAGRHGGQIASFGDSLWMFGGNNWFLNTEAEIWRFADLSLPAEGEGGGEGESETFHSADINQDNILSLHELLRAIQLYNLGLFHCDATAEDGFAPGTGDQSCAPHNSDYNPQDWIIALSELLRLIQLYNAFEIDYCPNVTPSTEDSFCLAPAFHNCQPMP